jgi:antitoxin component HigA of HigAB toxin-antitoxin module
MRTAMQIRPIRNDKDHCAALAEIDKLWGASIGTPEGDKLDILVTLVETYEERRWPLKSRRRFAPIDVMRSRNSVTVRRSLQTFSARGRALSRFTVVQRAA